MVFVACGNLVWSFSLTFEVRFGLLLSGRKKAHKHKLFALVNVQMALGQTAGCRRVDWAKKFMCSPRNTAKKKLFPPVNRRVVPGLSRLSKSSCVQSLCAFFLPYSLLTVEDWFGLSCLQVPSSGNLVWSLLLKVPPTVFSLVFCSMPRLDPHVPYILWIEHEEDWDDWLQPKEEKGKLCALSTLEGEQKRTKRKEFLNRLFLEITLARDTCKYNNHLKQIKGQLSEFGWF